MNEYRKCAECPTCGQDYCKIGEFMQTNARFYSHTEEWYWGKVVKIDKTLVTVCICIVDTLGRGIQTEIHKTFNITSLNPTTYTVGEKI